MKNNYFDFFDFILNQYEEKEDKPDINVHGLQLSTIQIDEEYAKKWNVTLRDFVCITKNGELLNPTLYRVGGMGTNKIKGKKYFLLLKHIEDIYEFEFIKKCYPEKNNKQLETQRKHLKSVWCIIDEFGTEKVEFDNFKSPYLIKDSCIYSLDSKYYNIETGELYCNSYSKMESDEYLFLENQFDKDKEKRGVLKIDKLTGEFELFKME